MNILGQILIGLIFISVVIFLSVIVVLSAYHWAVSSILKRYGKKSLAHVVDLNVDKSGRGKSYSVVFLYIVRDSIIENEQRVSRKTYKMIVYRSGPIPIMYLPFHAKVSRLANEYTDNSFRNDLTVFGFASVIVFPPSVLLWLGMYFLAFLWLSHISESEQSSV